MEKDAWFAWASTLRRRNHTEAAMVRKTYEQLFEQAMKTIIFANKYTTDKFSIYLVPISVVGLMAFDRTIARDYIMRRMIKLRVNVSLPDPNNPFLLMFVWFDIPQMTVTPEPFSVPPAVFPTKQYRSDKHSKKYASPASSRYESSSDASSENSENDDEESSDESVASEKHSRSSSAGRPDAELQDLYSFFRKVANPTKIIGK